MSRFGTNPRDFFASVYQAPPPWDIGGAQPALDALLDAYPPVGPVLDVGCGSGDLAIALAQRGLHVLGIDFIDVAIAQAHAKAARLSPSVARLLHFQVADALQPSRLAQQFGSVVDSGFFHLFESDERDRFIDELAATLLPGGRYYLLAFAVEFAPPSPRQVTEDEVRARFTPGSGWRIRELRSAEFLSHIAAVPAISACIEQLPNTLGAFRIH